MILASGWAGAVAGFAAGSLVPGAGNFVGAGVGLGVGVLSGVGYTLASPDTPVVDGLRGGIGGGNVTIREVPSGGAELNTLDGGS